MIKTDDDDDAILKALLAWFLDQDIPPDSGAAVAISVAANVIGQVAPNVIELRRAIEAANAKLTDDAYRYFAIAQALRIKR
jgi:hypothetical protein